MKKNSALILVCVPFLILFACAPPSEVGTQTVNMTSNLPATLTPETTSNRDEATPVPPEPKESIVNGIGDGIWMVGSDIQPGTYETPNNQGNCYWSRLKGFSGELEDIIANGNPQGRAIVTILDSDAGFKSQRCGEWKPIEKPIVLSDNPSPTATQVPTITPTLVTNPIPTETVTPSAAPAQLPTITPTSIPQPTLTVTPTVTATVEPTTEPSPTVTSIPTAVATEKTDTGDGTWLVGTDIQPGTYEISNASLPCYWARLRGTSGALGDVIANGLPIGRAVVTVLDTDVAFTSQGCGTWTPLAPADTQKDGMGEGTWLVNNDIRPGTYEATITEGPCYWSRLRGFTGELDQIIVNGVPFGRAVVTIADSDIGFSSQGCGPWKPLGTSNSQSKVIPVGTWIVGDDIKPGIYRASDIEDTCYWSRIKGFSGELKDLIANDIVFGTGTVAISNTDAGFTSQGCGTWTMMEATPTPTPIPTQVPLPAGLVITVDGDDWRVTTTPLLVDDEITIMYSNMPTGNGEWIGLFAIGDTYSQFKAYKPLASTSGSTNIKLAHLAGQYELRLYDSTNNLISKSPKLTVNPPPTQTPTPTATPTMTPTPIPLPGSGELLTPGTEATERIRTILFPGQVHEFYFIGTQGQTFFVNIRLPDFERPRWDLYAPSGDKETQSTYTLWPPLKESGLYTLKVQADGQHTSDVGDYRIQVILGSVSTPTPVP